MKIIKSFVLVFYLFGFFYPILGQQNGDSDYQHNHHNHMQIDYEKRDEWQQPKKILKIIGVKKGMKIGEIGAGEGYFTFYLSKKVAKKGRIYANDITDEHFLDIKKKSIEEKTNNIVNILGTEGSSGFEKNLKLDMIVMMHSYHYIEEPANYLISLKKHLNPEGKIVIIHWDSKKIQQNPIKYSKQNLIESIKGTGLELLKIDELIYDNIYILKFL